MKKFVLFLFLSLVVSTYGWCKSNYNTQAWQEANHEAIQRLFSGPAEQWVTFSPHQVSSMSTFDRMGCMQFGFLDVLVFFDKSQHAIVYRSESAREDYYILFDNVSNAVKGIGEYEMLLECRLTRTEVYDVVYNVRTHQARRVDNVATGLLRRFESREPQMFKHGIYTVDAKLMQQWHDVFKALTGGDYVGAQNQLQGFIKQANREQGIGDDLLHWECAGIFDAYPLMELAQAMLMSYPADYSGRGAMRVGCDPVQAYQYIREIYRRTTGDNDAYLNYPNAILGQSDVRSSVDNIKQTIEQKMLDYARTAGTIEAYDRVIQAAAFVNDALRQQARQEQESLAYGTVDGCNDIDRYEAYLVKYEGLSGLGVSHYQAIEQQLYKLAYDQMPRTLAGCRRYLAHYDTSPYVEEVRSQLSEFAFDELEPTAASCRAYLDEFHGSKHNDEVWYKLYEYAYNELGDNLEACEQYLVKYPGSGYCDQVRSKIVNIKYANACAADTWEAYDAFVKETGYNTHTADAKRRMAELAREAGLDDVDDESTNVTPSATSGRTVHRKAQNKKPSAKPVVQSKKPVQPSKPKRAKPELE